MKESFISSVKFRLKYSLLSYVVSGLTRVDHFDVH